MTPAARLATAAGLLDEIAAGCPAEKALTRWARKSRFAGSKDREAVRDAVFDVLRMWRSCAARGGGETGRALILGLLLERGEDPDLVFTGEGHAPAPLAPDERMAIRDPTRREALDLPDWLLPDLEASLGADLPGIAALLRRRADLFLRWHAGRTTADDAIAALAEDGVVAEPHPLAPTALRVVEGQRALRRARAYTGGLVEVQDAASQAVCAALQVGPGVRVLDLCAGGGGKGLALAARGAEVTAHDVAPARMRDLPDRATRAGTPIRIATPETLAGLPRFDLVVADVPCSGSGAWRRQAEAKWRLSRAGLDDLLRVQADLLLRAASHVGAGGRLAYVTCSLLEAENAAQIDRFLAAQPGRWRQERRLHLTPRAGGDGFFLALLALAPDEAR